VNSTAYGTCPRGTECVSINMVCTNARCICSVEDGMAGPSCGDFTLRSFPVLIGRSAELVGFVPLAVVFGLQFRRTWRASRHARRTWIFKFLMAPLALILCGIWMMLANAIVALLTLTGTIHLTSVEGTIWSNLLNGVGTLFLNLGFAVIPMLWCEIGIASSRFRRMHNALRLSERVLTVFLFLNVVTAIALALVAPFYPFYAEQWLGLVAFVSVFLIVITHKTGAWMLSRALGTTQGVRPESLPQTGRRESIDAEAATLQAKSTSRYFTRCALAALLGVVLWQYGRYLAYSGSDHTHSAPIVTWAGIGLIKVVGIIGLCLCELRYIRWTTEASSGSQSETTSAEKAHCRAESRTSSDDMSVHDLPSPGRGSCSAAVTEASLAI